MVSLRCCALLLAVVVSAAAQDAWPAPHLLLTGQRLRRLQRDRERQTERWLNLAARVASAPDSPERGFELALSAIVSHDAAQGRAAVVWALAHSCETRQVALVLDWVGQFATAPERQQITAGVCPAAGGTFARLRDHFFMQVAKGEDVEPADVRVKEIPSERELYALLEYLDAYHNSQFEDLRRQDVAFYSQLPSAYLLSFRPAELQAPSWRAHVNALALVALDPNMEGSQLLQGWALESRFVAQSGPGVAYEFLWADPYLPGVGYQNMDPWSYLAEDSRLEARTDWTPGACWISVSKGAIEQVNCPEGWRNKNMRFGSLTLSPLRNGCVDLPGHGERNDATIVWFDTPRQSFNYVIGGNAREQQADDAGLWLMPQDRGGRACLGTKLGAKLGAENARRH